MNRVYVTLYIGVNKLMPSLTLECFPGSILNDCIHSLFILVLVSIVEINAIIINFISIFFYYQ